MLNFLTSYPRTARILHLDGVWNISCDGKAVIFIGANSKMYRESQDRTCTESLCPFIIVSGGMETKVGLTMAGLVLKQLCHQLFGVDLGITHVEADLAKGFVYGIPEAFPGSIRVICYFHMDQALRFGKIQTKTNSFRLRNKLPFFGIIVHQCKSKAMTSAVIDYVHKYILKEFKAESVGHHWLQLNKDNEYYFASSGEDGIYASTGGTNESFHKRIKGGGNQQGAIRLWNNVPNMLVNAIPGLGELVYEEQYRCLFEPPHSGIIPNRKRIDNEGDYKLLFPRTKTRTPLSFQAYAALMNPEIDILLKEKICGDDGQPQVLEFYSNTPRYFGVEITQERIDEYESLLKGGDNTTLTRLSRKVRKENFGRKISDLDLAWNVCLTGNSFCKVTVDLSNPDKKTALGDCISCTKDLCCPACVVLLDRYNVLVPTLSEYVAPIASGARNRPRPQRHQLGGYRLVQTSIFERPTKVIHSETLRKFFLDQSLISLYQMCRDVGLSNSELGVVIPSSAEDVLDYGQESGEEGDNPGQEDEDGNPNSVSLSLKHLVDVLLGEIFESEDDNDRRTLLPEAEDLPEKRKRSQLRQHDFYYASDDQRIRNARKKKKKLIH